MLTERIIGALTFRRGVYAEVEADKTFTATAGKNHHQRDYRFHPLGDHHDPHRRRFDLARPDRDRVRHLAWLVVLS
jgi:hypothetical protein